jgi:hypothetical protein
MRVNAPGHVRPRPYLERRHAQVSGPAPRQQGGRERPVRTLISPSTLRMIGGYATAMIHIAESRLSARDAQSSSGGLSGKPRGPSASEADADRHRTGSGAWARRHRDGSCWRDSSADGPKRLLPASRASRHRHHSPTIGVDGQAQPSLSGVLDTHRPVWGQAPNAALPRLARDHTVRRAGRWAYFSRDEVG